MLIMYCFVLSAGRTSIYLRIFNKAIHYTPVSFIIGNTNAVHLDPIIKLQKKIVRTITFSHYLTHTELIFDTLTILNFYNLVVHRISLMMFKYSKDLVPLPIVKLFTRHYEFHNHFTRQSQSLHTAVCRN